MSATHSDGGFLIPQPDPLPVLPASLRDGPTEEGGDGDSGEEDGARHDVPQGPVPVSRNAAAIGGPAAGLNERGSRAKKRRRVAAISA